MDKVEIRGNNQTDVERFDVCQNNVEQTASPKTSEETMENAAKSCWKLGLYVKTQDVHKPAKVAIQENPQTNHKRHHFSSASPESCYSKAWFPNERSHSECDVHSTTNCDWPLLTRHGTDEKALQKTKLNKPQSLKTEPFGGIFQKKIKLEDTSKRKKWSCVSICDLGFNLSIIPFIIEKRHSCNLHLRELEEFSIAEQNNCATVETIGNTPQDPVQWTEKQHSDANNNNVNDNITTTASSVSLNDTKSGATDVELVGKNSIIAKSNRTNVLVSGSVTKRSTFNARKTRKRRRTKKVDGFDEQYRYEQYLTEECEAIRKCLEFEGSGNTRIRHKRKWRHEKAHKQIKSKHCRTVHNGGYGKKLFIKHRIAKNMTMCLGGYTYKCISGLTIKAIDKSKGFKLGETPSRASYNGVVPRVTPQTAYPTAPVVPSYAMTAYNADGDLAANAANILMNLQYRELTPEDYEMLLVLDDRVKPKTVSQTQLETLLTSEVTEISCMQLSDDHCAICMEMYSMGQERRELPCTHAFHLNCIDMWLTNSSVNCPLDGTEVFPS